MELVNQTSYEASLFHGPEGPDHHGAAVIVKMTKSLVGGFGRTEPEFVWPVSRKDLETDYGNFPMDHHFPIGKMDVMVCGDAVPPQGRAVRLMEVVLQVGGLRYSQAIFGDRVWRKRLLGYEMTDPAPFNQMPLVLARAFGGKAELENGDFPWSENPDGVGFIMEGQEIEGKALPNIERPDQLIRKPFDYPTTTCMTPYPLGWKCRVDRLFENGELRPFSAADAHLYFGQAHPDLMIARTPPGTAVRLTGMAKEGDFAFEVPPLGFAVEVDIDGRREAMPVTLDGMCIFAQHKCVGFRYRAATRFLLEPRQQRKVILREV